MCVFSVCAGARPLCLTESQDKQKVLAALVSSTSRFLKKKQEEVIDGGGGQPMYRSNRAVHRHCCALPFQLRGQNNFLERILPFSPPSSLVSVSSSSSCVVWLFFFFFFAKQFPPPPLLGRLRGRTREQLLWNLTGHFYDQQISSSCVSNGHVVVVVVVVVELRRPKGRRGGVFLQSSPLGEFVTCCQVFDMQFCTVGFLVEPLVWDNDFFFLVFTSIPLGALKGRKLLLGYATLH